MLKFVVVLYRRPDLPVEQFRSILRGEHSVLAERLPGLRKYVQNHVASDPRRKHPGWDAVVELYWDDWPSMEAAWATAEGQRATEHLSEFVDLSRSTWSVVEEEVLRFCTRWRCERHDAEGEEQMTVKDLESLYDYGYWANRKLFAVISRLTPEQFTQPVAGSYGSVRDTMVHVLSTEAGWLSRCGGPERGPRLNPADFPTVESLERACTRVETHVREFLAKLKDEDLARHAEYATDRAEKLSMPLGELMQHAATHGVHHRGQVALLLRLLGHAPGNFDILFYYADRRGVRAW